MLKKEKWQNIFEVARSSGCSAFDFYADSWNHRYLSFENKHLRLKSCETGGARFLFQNDRGPTSFQSTCLDPELFFSYVQGGTCEPAFSTLPSLQKIPVSSEGQEKLIEQICRRLLLELPGLDQFHASYEEHHKDFLVAHEQTELRQGSESVARFHLNFVLKKGSRSKSFSLERGTTEPAVLLNELEKWSFSKDLLEKSLEKPWPAPKGNLALHWSSQSVAQFGACFLKMLEFFSRNASQFSHFLRQCPLLGFQLIDNWKNQAKVDVEGMERFPTLILDGNQPILLLNEKLPGFARRQTHEHFPITAPWEPALFGLERSSQLLDQMPDGISVKELRLRNFHVPSGTLTFQIEEAVLVHQGKAGESIEPVLVQAPLLEILSGLKLFSEKTSPNPLDWTSGGQTLFVEFTAPEALSPRFEFPGTVPLSHYW